MLKVKKQMITTKREAETCTKAATSSNRRWDADQRTSSHQIILSNAVKIKNADSKDQ